MYQKGNAGKSTFEHSDLTYSSEEASNSKILRKCILALLFKN